uniref:Uncharacterized protein n=1 Tax=Clostridium botulinum TaxID=1491 RepID=A0A126JJA7_CLOBO|nr:hypothetical protein [Clostridium botulinum]ALT05766.1 hypothetical protein [Clostridium botulinum]
MILIQNINTNLLHHFTVCTCACHIHYVVSSKSGNSKHIWMISIKIKSFSKFIIILSLKLSPYTSHFTLVIVSIQYTFVSGR